MKQLLFCLCLLTGTFLSAQNWEQVASVSNDFRTDHSYGFAINGTGYLVTGTDDDMGITKDFYSYDPDTDVWTQKEDFPGPARGFAIGEVYDGKAYLGFGNGPNGSLRDLWVYDPDTDTWTELASCTCLARTHPAMVALDGILYIGLGGGNYDDWWAYDIDADSWEQKANFPAAGRHHPFQFTDGEYVYVGNGHGTGFISNNWYQYNPMTDTWVEVASMPAEGRVAGAQFSRDGYGYVLSGDGDDHGFMETGEFWKYDPGINIWIQLPSHPGRSRWAPASFIIDNEIYIINGWNQPDGYFDENYKLDLTSFDGPTLRLISPSSEEISFDNATEEYCNPFSVNELVINTPAPFADDVTFQISINAASTAVEGVDFILSENESTLTSGELETTVELLVFDDAVANGDKIIIFDLSSTEEVSLSQRRLDIPENDFEFGASNTGQELQLGTADGTTGNIFGGYYTTMNTQVIYQREVLEQSGIFENDFTHISFEVTAKNSTAPYNDFTIRMANTNINNVSGGLLNSVDFIEVYNGQVNATLGNNEIELDTPFQYDGVSNIALQICFDNNNYTLDDAVSTFSVSYDALISFKDDNIPPCPSAGQITELAQVPAIKLVGTSPPALYSQIGNPLRSSISAGETIYLQSNDSILLSINALQDTPDDCWSASLLSNSHDILGEPNLEWLDRVCHIESEEMPMQDVAITIVYPADVDLDWTPSGLSMLYTPENVSGVMNPSWEGINVLGVETTQDYVYVTVAYAGNGSYAVSDSDLVSVDDPTPEDIISFDEIQYFDILGRRVDLDENLRNYGFTRAVYIKTYLNKGIVVKSEAILY